MTAQNCTMLSIEDERYMPARAFWYEDLPALVFQEGTNIAHNVTQLTAYKRLMLLSCSYKDTRSHRVGPFSSSGGYDWWQLGWYDVGDVYNEIKFGQKTALTRYLHRIMDSSGVPIGFPPIHLHHVHFNPAVPKEHAYNPNLFAPRFNPLSDECLIWGIGCDADPAAYFDAHGESQCMDTNESNSFHCMNFEHSFDKSPLEVKRAIEVILMMNDVRPQHSVPMTFYYYVSLSFRANSLMDSTLQYTSRHIQADPSGIRPSINNLIPSGALLHVNTVQDSVSIYRFSLPFRGRLLPNVTWIHGHWSSMEFAILVEESLCVSPLQWGKCDGPKPTSALGFPNNLLMRAHILQECSTGVVCEAQGNRILLNHNEFDRFPNISCNAWELEDSVLTSVAFHGHITGRNIRAVEFAHVNWNILYRAFDNHSHFTSNFANEPRSDVLRLSPIIREMLLFLVWNRHAAQSVASSVTICVLGSLLSVGFLLILRNYALTITAAIMACNFLLFNLYAPVEVYLMRDEDSATLLLKRHDFRNFSLEVRLLILTAMVCLVVLAHLHTKWHAKLNPGTDWGPILT